MSVTTGTIPGVRIGDMPDLGSASSGASVVGEKAGSGRFQMNAIRDYVVTSNKGVGGFYVDLSPYAHVTYGADRLFAGAATAWSGATGGADTTWLAAAFPGFTVHDNATFASVDNFSMMAVAGATRSTNSRPAAQQVVIGGSFFANNEATTYDVSTWGVYVDARRQLGAGATVAIESDVTNLGALAPTNPFTYQPVGATTNLWLATGSGLTSGLTPASSCITILPNGTTYQTGIVFANTALTGTDGLTGLGTAMLMANRQAIGWTNSAGASVGTLTSQTTTASNAQGISFTDGGIAVVTTGATVQNVIIPPVPACNASLVLSGGYGSTPPDIGSFYNGGSGSMAVYVTPQNSGALIVGGSVQPVADNTYACGVSGKRWSNVWATNGTIQTSDPDLKTDIADLPAALPLIAAIQPKVFRWKDSPERTVTTSTMEVPVTRTVTKTIQDHEVRPNGSVHLVQRTIETEEDEIDLVPVTYPDGSPVMDDVPLPTMAGRPRRYEKRQRLHPVPRTRTVPKETTTFVSRPGQRLHWGFLAPDVKAAFDGIGMDFGGYVLGEDGSHNLRPDQLIPVLWKAVSELAAEFAAYKAAHP